MEILAYLASKSLAGRKVEISNTREEDISTSPCKIGGEAEIKLVANQYGIIQGLKSTFYLSKGGYSDSGPRMGKAIAVDCTGPYNIENLSCDVLCIYTNQTYVTSFRGFGHIISNFCLERILDKLAEKLGLCPMEIRLRNIIKQGNLSPTQEMITDSNAGNMKKCISSLKKMMNWDQGRKSITKEGNILVKGISCFWKTAVSPTNASAGALLSLNSDGSINVNIGAVEIGPGMKTTICQILAEKMKMDINKIHITYGVDTHYSPIFWKTVASTTTFMVGNAVLKAADDLIHQLKMTAAIPLKIAPEFLDIEDGKVFFIGNPSMFVFFKDLAHGYKSKDGPSQYGQILARGTYTVDNLTPLDNETGMGRVGVSWTLGAQGVVIEYNPRLYSYRFVKAYTAIDVGKVINPKTAKGVVMGGMSMGLSLASREELLYDNVNKQENTSLRTYKLLRRGEHPQYMVDFIETPQLDGPFGARGLGEHGIIGIPAALANALSYASEVELDSLPLTPETIWKVKLEGKNDSL